MEADALYWNAGPDAEHVRATPVGLELENWLRRNGYDRETRKVPGTLPNQAALAPASVELPRERAVEPVPEPVVEQVTVAVKPEPDVEMDPVSVESEAPSLPLPSLSDIKPTIVPSASPPPTPDDTVAVAVAVASAPHPLPSFMQPNQRIITPISPQLPSSAPLSPPPNPARPPSRLPDPPTASTSSSASIHIPTPSSFILSAIPLRFSDPNPENRGVGPNGRDAQVWIGGILTPPRLTDDQLKERLATFLAKFVEHSHIWGIEFKPTKRRDCCSALLRLDPRADLADFLGQMTRKQLYFNAAPIYFGPNKGYRSAGEINALPSSRDNPRPGRNDERPPPQPQHKPGDSSRRKTHPPTRTDASTSRHRGRSRSRSRERSPSPPRRRLRDDSPPRPRRSFSPRSRPPRNSHDRESLNSWRPRRRSRSRSRSPERRRPRSPERRRSRSPARRNDRRSRSPGRSLVIRGTIHLRFLLWNKLTILAFVGIANAEPVARPPRLPSRSPMSVGE